MLYKDEITLVSVSTKRDKDGFPEADVQLTEIFADVQSAKRREFYEALRSGIQMDIACRIRSIDYGRQKYVRWESTWYRVVRAYQVEDWTELNCEEVTSLEPWMTEVDVDANHQ